MIRTHNHIHCGIREGPSGDGPSRCSWHGRQAFTKAAYAVGIYLLILTWTLCAPGQVQAYVIADPGGGTGSGSGGGTGGESEEPRIVDTKEKVNPDEMEYAGYWDWAPEPTAVLDIQYDPGYPQYKDRVSHEKTLRWIYSGKTWESSNYIFDEYNPEIRRWYDQWRLERGELVVARLRWAPVYRIGRVYTCYIYSNGQEDCEPSGWEKVEPVAELGNLYYPAQTRIRFPDYFGNPIKVPPDPPEAPPLLSYPEDYLGDQLYRDDYRYEDYIGDPGTFLFGGQPYSDPASGTRGESATLAITSKVTGFPGGQHEVTSASARVLDGFPWTGRLSFGIRPGGDPRDEAIWTGLLPIPDDTPLGRYRVEVTIQGRNAWGMPRTKIIYMTLIVDAGDRCDRPSASGQCDDRKTRPGDRGLCGMSEEDIRRTPRWWLRCSKPRLLK